MDVFLHCSTNIVGQSLRGQSRSTEIQAVCGLGLGEKAALVRYPMVNVLDSAWYVYMHA